MVYGFLLTGIALVVLVVWGLIEIRRIDRIIAAVDRKLGPPEKEKDRS
jgi:hypothetical protein